MAEESKLTLKVGVIASFIAAVMIFILQSLWAHQTDISMLKTNQEVLLKTNEKLADVPANIVILKEMMVDNKQEHNVIMRRLETK